MTRTYILGVGGKNDTVLRCTRWSGSMTVALLQRGLITPVGVHRPRARVTRAVAVVPHEQYSSADDAVRQAELEAWLGPEVEDDPVQRYLPGDRVRVCAAWYSLQTVFGWGQSIKSCLRVGGS